MMLCHEAEVIVRHGVSPRVTSPVTGDTHVVTEVNGTDDIHAGDRTVWEVYSKVYATELVSLC